MSGDFIDFSTVRRALVIKLRHHGDVLLTSPVFTVLKNHAPHIEVDALVYRETEPMLSGHPAITNVFTIDRSWKQENWTTQKVHEWRLFRSLRARHYNLIIHLTENPRGAVLSRLLKPHYSIARDYPAKRGRLWQNSFTHLYQSPDKRHTVEMHLDALRRLGLYPRADERRLVLTIGEEAERSVHEVLSLHGLTPKGFIHLHPTSRWMFKSWDADKNAALVTALQEAGEPVVMTAAPSEPELQFVARIIARLKKPIVDLSGKLNIKQLAALTAQAKCFVGLDSMPMHIAAAVQTPCVVMFGPSNELIWGPWRVRHRVLTLPYSCRPCGIDGCGGGKVSECLTDISVDDALSAIREILSVR